eukprot:1162719-Alexandrium_andersonii.AAC.1
MPPLDHSDGHFQAVGQSTPSHGPFRSEQICANGTRVPQASGEAGPVATRWLTEELSHDALLLSATEARIGEGSEPPRERAQSPVVALVDPPRHQQDALAQHAHLLLVARTPQRNKANGPSGG